MGSRAIVHAVFVQLLNPCNNSSLAVPVGLKCINNLQLSQCFSSVKLQNIHANCFALFGPPLLHGLLSCPYIAILIICLLTANSDFVEKILCDGQPKEVFTL